MSLRTLLIAGALASILSVYTIKHLKVHHLVPGGFSGCGRNLALALTLVAGTLICIGCARYFRYAAYGPFRTFGGFYSFVGRVACMGLWYGIAAVLGLYGTAFVQIARAKC